MSKIRIKKGDLVILQGRNYFEKVEVTSVKKRIASTNVGVKFNSRTLETINSIFTVIPYTDKDYEKVQALYRTPSMIRTLARFVDDHQDDIEMLLKVFKGLERINKKIYQ